ncbi:MAG TPA: RNA polymerase factor sigma-54 [Acidisarcina sp.]
MAFLQPKLNLNVSQRQILTPGLMQMVSVLALNQLELKEMIDAEIVENPVLEELDEHVPLIDDMGSREAQMERPAEDLAADALREKKDPFDEIDFGSYFQDYLDPGFRAPNNFEVTDKPSFEHFLSQPSTLTDHLAWQLGSLSLSDKLRDAAEYIIGNLNEDGYLTSSEEELVEGYLRQQSASGVVLDIAAFVRDDELAAIQAIVSDAAPDVPPSGRSSRPEQARTLLAAALKTVQNLDPIGIATRDLRECLLVQIEAQRRGFELLNRAGHSALPDLDISSAVPPANLNEIQPPAAGEEHGAGDLERHPSQPLPMNDAAASADVVALAGTAAFASGTTGRGLPGREGASYGTTNAPFNGRAEIFNTAARLVDKHLSLLQKRDLREVARAVGKSHEQVQIALDFIRTLDPRPGQRFSNSDARLIEPDVAFVKRDGEYIVVMNEEQMPTLRLNQGYRKMLTQEGTEKDVKEYVKERYRSALQLMRNIEQRKNTILRTCEAIVRRQGDFLERGVEAIKPMMIKDVAEEIGVHPSTVSRAVSNKYVHTQQGVFELRFFFSEAVNGPEGGGTPLMLLKRKVKKFIEDEDPRKPLTDDHLAAMLQQQGIDVTRRTVAKYREDLRIPSTHQRRVRD